MKQAQTEARQIERLRQVDRDAFDAYVAEHDRLVAALAQSMGFRGADLDDAVTEVFAEAWLALPKFEGRSTLRTWTYRIAIRTLGKLRDRQRRRAAALPTVEPADTQPDPAERTESLDANALLWAAVAGLDTRSAAAVELYYRQSRSIAQIAEALECPEGTVKTLLHRARETLRQALKTQEVHR